MQPHVPRTVCLVVGDAQHIASPERHALMSGVYRPCLLATLGSAPAASRSETQLAKPFGQSGSGRVR